MDIWREGKYVDMWSVPHLLSGIIFTGWLLVFGFDIWKIFFLHLALSILWEFVESFKKIHEHFNNKVVDVILGNVGFFLVFLFSIRTDILMLLSVLYVLLEISGHLAYRRRSK